MTHKVDLKKITAGVVKAEKEKNTSYYLLERIGDYEKLFTDIFLEYFVLLVGNDGWGIFFRQVHPQAPSFIIDVYLDNKNKFHLFEEGIREMMPKEMRITLLVIAGTTKDYEGQLLGSTETQ